MKLTLVTTEGIRTERETDDALSTIKEMMPNCFFERVSMDSLDIYIDDDAINKQLPINGFISRLTGKRIFGDCVIVE
jgi:hypothetical protein